MESGLLDWHNASLKPNQPLSRLPLATLGYTSPKGEKPVPTETKH